MKILFLIRHAKSSWDDPGTKDFDRTLNARGLKDADEMAGRLTTRIKTIDAFISSPANRARTTAEKFADAFAVPASGVMMEAALYLAPAAVFIRLISNTSNTLQTVAIFAHNPGITDFANTLTAAARTDNIPTCGIFAVSAATDNWKDFDAAAKTLLFYDYPKLTI